MMDRYKNPEFTIGEAKVFLAAISGTEPEDLDGCVIVSRKHDGTVIVTSTYGPDHPVIAQTVLALGIITVSNGEKRDNTGSQ